jgi:hypothetical protein
MTEDEENWKEVVYTIRLDNFFLVYGIDRHIDFDTTVSYNILIIIIPKTDIGNQQFMKFFI